MKLIKESLNHSFTQGKVDKLSTLGVGKVEMIKKWLEDYGVKLYNINDDLTIDVHWDVNLGSKNLKKLPEYINFNKIINGTFVISDNHLTTFRGCPKWIEFGFWSENNDVASIDYIPVHVGTAYHLTGCSNLSRKEIQKIKNIQIPKSTIFINVEHESLNESFFGFINESPDQICKNGYNMHGSCLLREKPYLVHGAPDALSFGYSHMDDPIILGEKGDEHVDLGLSRYVDFYLGRIWLNSRIISFWKYPETKTMLEKIIKDIEKELLKFDKYVSIWNDPNFMIETIVSKTFINDLDEFKSKTDWRNSTEIHTEMIPLKSYKGSLDIPEEWLDIEHAVSPLNKKHREVPENTGSNKYRSSKPLKLRQHLQTENLKFPKL